MIIFSIESHSALRIPIIPADHPQASVWGRDDDVYAEEYSMNYLLNLNDLVFDVGANCGNWSKLALQIEPTLCLYLFEPLPQIFADKISKLSFSPHLYNFAFSNQVGKSAFYNQNFEMSPGSGFFLRPQLIHSIKIEVDTDTIDHFCSLHQVDRIDYLKIDTEGGELRVLQGALNMLMSHQITTMQFEYGGCYLDAHTTLHQMMQLLTQAGYAVFRTSSHGLIHIDRWDNNSLEDYRYAIYVAVVQSVVPNYGLVQGLN